MCALCGLFGSHKEHKITTQNELKDLNNQLIESHKKWLNELIDLEELDSINNFKDYIQYKTKGKMKELKKKALKVYSDSKKILKEFIFGFVSEMEKDVRQYIEDKLDTYQDSSSGFEQFKAECEGIAKKLHSIDKENNKNKGNLFNAYNSLKKMEDSIKGIEQRTETNKNLINRVNEIELETDFDKISLINSITLKRGPLSDKSKFKIEDGLFLLNSISNHDNLEDLKPVSENELSNIELGQEAGIRPQLEDESEDTIKKSETSSFNRLIKPKLTHHLYKHNINQQSNNYVSAVFSDKKFSFDGMFNQNRKQSHQTELYTERGDRERPTLKNSSSLQNLTVKQNSIGKMYKQVSKLNLYSHKERNNSFNNSNLKMNLRKMTTRDLSPSNLIYELSNKNTILTIKNRNIDEIDLHRILNDAFEQKKLINKINFRDNLFDFDILQFLKRHFIEKRDKQICLDLRRNKIKVNNRKIEFVKKNLMMHNVKILI